MGSGASKQVDAELLVGAEALRDAMAAFVSATVSCGSGVAGGDEASTASAHATAAEDFAAQARRPAQKSGGRERKINFMRAGGGEDDGGLVAWVRALPGTGLGYTQGHVDQLLSTAREVTKREVEKLDAVRMLAALEEMYQEEGDKGCTQKLSTFFQSKIPRDQPEAGGIWNSKPCIGQYEPKYTIVHRTPCRPPDWDREGARSARRARPASAPAGAQRTPASPPDADLEQTVTSQAAAADAVAAAAGNLNLDMMNVNGEVQGMDQGKDGAGRMPSDFRKWVDRTRGGRGVDGVRPSSAFTSTARKPLMTSTTPSPGQYWPYNCVQKRHNHHICMDKGQGREGRQGFLQGPAKTPDVVYDVTRQDKIATPSFHLQPPRKPLNADDAPAAHSRSYDADPRVLSTTRKTPVVDFSKSEGHTNVAPKADVRKPLEPNYDSVTPCPSVGVDIGKQTHHPIPKSLTTNLDYTPEYGGIDKNSSAVNMNFGGGHGDLFVASPTNALSYDPSDAAVRRRGSRGPNMARSTSRKKNFGAFVPVRMLDCVYSWEPQGKGPKPYGMKFEKQVGRDRRERALKQKLTRSDNFYNVQAPKIPNIIPFEKTLARGKRGPAKLR